MSQGNDRRRDPRQGRIRVTLEFSRSDDPLLFDALMGLPKGRRRVATLRTLAHDGLLAARPPASSSRLSSTFTDQASAVIPPGELHALQALDPELTGGVFENPLNE